MNLFKQVCICIRGQKVQTIILFCVIFLLSTLVAGAMMVNQAITNMDIALRSMLPAVTILQHDNDHFFFEWHETGEWPNRENMTVSRLYELGTLPYVRSFSFSVHGYGFYSATLARVWYPELYLSLSHPIDDAVDEGSLSRWRDTHLEQFALNGVGTVNIFEIEFDIIELVSGRIFNMNEVEQGVPAAIVSQSFLNVNNLAVGDKLILDHIIQDYDQPEEDWLKEETFLARQAYEFEIIGSFHRQLPDDRDLFGIDIQEHHLILNEIFVPATFIEEITSIELEVFNNAEIMQIFARSETILDALDFSNMHFLLYDPLDLQDFHTAVAETLPEFWMMTDYSFAYADIANSMILIQEVADGTLIGAAIAMLTVLSLLILLFLRNRVKEIGIYLALGRSKGKIMTQIILEVFIPTIMAITLALFVGNLFFSTISKNMLHNHIANLEHRLYTPGDWQIPGFRHGLTNEELVEMFEVVIDARTTLMFYSFGLGMVFLSGTASVLYTLRMNPKDILTSG